MTLHAVLASVGSDGDVLPFLGLGTRLRARGCRVTLVANEPHREAARGLGLEFRSLVSREETDEAFSDPRVWEDSIRGGVILARWGARFLERQFALLDGLAAEGPCVLAASPGVLAARLVQERRGLRLASVILQPWMVPSLDAPPIMPGGLTLPRWTPRPLGRLYLGGLNALGDVLMGRTLNRLRASLGMRRIRAIFRWWWSPDLVAGLFPAWYGEPQADWLPQIRLAGFPRGDGRPAAGLAPEVREFCEAGSPPVAITFGTEMRHPGRLFRMALEACCTIGARAILITRHAGQVPHPLPPWARHVEHAPFRELFPRCAAAIHHGGVGTVAAALASGTPQLVLPLAFDQRDNALRVTRLGAGDWIRPGRVSGPRLAETLARLITGGPSTACRDAARRSAEEDGLERAAGWVEELGSS